MQQSMYLHCSDDDDDDDDNDDDDDDDDDDKKAELRTDGWTDKTAYREAIMQ